MPAAVALPAAVGALLAKRVGLADLCRGELFGGATAKRLLGTAIPAGENREERQQAGADINVCWRDVG